MIDEVKFYISLFLRRIHYFLLIVIFFGSIGGFLAFTLPPIFRAQARLLVESPQIPDDLAASTVRAGALELLSVIQQRILTRANLLEMARKFNIYAATPNASVDMIVNDMRNRVGIVLPYTLETGGIVLLSFETPSPALSVEVTNDLLTQVLQQNVALRTEASGQTLDFFENEVTRLDKKLGEQDARILEFKLQHKDALPESLNYRRTRLASLQERALQINRELSSLTDRRGRLEELFERTGRVDLNDANLSPEQRQLRELQEQLASALVIYSPENPRVRALEAQVKALELAVGRQGSENSSPLATAYDLQISDIDGQIAYLADQKEVVEAEMVELTISIDATPENAIALGTLERDYENTRLQFDQATAALNEARTGDRIETLSKGQRIVVIEPASTPDSPSKPNRKMILAAGLGGGIAAGLGFIFLLELLNRSIRRPVELTNGLGIKPFATLPYIRTGRQKLVRRLVITTILLSVAVGLPLGLYMLHLHVMPIDMIVDKVIQKLGLQSILDRLTGSVGG
ncbi:lipopolysaccharide biosynthesis protein [Sedimentitalea sp.]|uniref:GumC family protein n=1 Tax=Sedimentitalea sp. TaxID=2048915 RepID=UPI0032988E6C